MDSNNSKKSQLKGEVIFFAGGITMLIEHKGNSHVLSEKDSDKARKSGNNKEKIWKILEN